MKDLYIPAKSLKREIIIFVACFVSANLLNLYAILSYKTAIHELFTQIGYVILFSIILYFLLGIVRILVRLIIKTLKSFKTR